jgi:hypothetical protein
MRHRFSLQIYPASSKELTSTKVSAWNSCSMQSAQRYSLFKLTDQALLFVIDGSTGNSEDEKRTPVDDYLTLLNELKHYNKGALLAKPSLIVNNCS